MKTQDPGYIFGPSFIPNCAAIRLIWTLPNNKVANNILHSAYTTAPPNTQGFVNSLFTSIATAFTSSGYAAQTATSFKLTAIGVRDLASQVIGGQTVGHGEIVSNLAAVPGTGTGDPLPPNVSFVVSLKTGLSLQANRGRVYLTGYTEQFNLAGGVADPAVGVDAVTFMTGIQSALNPALGPLVIAHPARAGYTSPVTGRPIPPRSPGTVLVTNVAVLNNVWDSTRLRSLR